ncbi:MAG: DNA primase [Limisphaerales bacterium]
MEKVRAASDIVDVVGSYLPLKRAGGSFVALCPFHKEKTPSFNVNPHRQIFYCFGCHKGGDVFAFVKEYESVDFPEAVKRLAERAKIPLEFESGGQEQQSRHLKEQLLQIHEQIAQRWQNALASEAAGQVARDYLGKRAVSAEAIKLFRIGCAPEAWDDTVNWSRSKGFDLGLVEKAGLILRKEGTDHYYDRFRGRLMFPICDEQGRVVGFSGRVLSGDEKTAKYVNSPETPIFTKSKVFFGLDKSKRALVEAEFAIVCEGQLDLIACFMAGVQNVVAPQGTAFTADHSRILKRYVNEVVLCFDSDEAGQNATARSLDHLLAAELAVRVAVLPPPHDPDSFIKAFGGPAFKQLIERAEGFFDYYLNRLCSINEVTTDRGRLAVLHGMAEAVHKTGNVVLIDTYAQKTALRLGVAPDSVRAEFRKIRRAGTSQPDEMETAAPSQDQRPALTRDEFGLLQLLFKEDDLVEWTAAHLDLAWIANPLVRKIVTERVSALRTGTWQGVPSFLDSLADGESQGLIANAISSNYLEGVSGRALEMGLRDHVRDRVLPNPLEELKGLVTGLRNEHLALEINRLNTQMAALEAGSPEQIQIIRRREVLKARRKQPLAPLAPENSEVG